MGKLEKSIYAVIILILVAVIASGTTYLIMRDKDNTNTENNEIIDKDKESNDNKDNEKEEITLSEKELREYLDYLPKNYLDEENNSLFTKSNINVNDISTETLVGNALSLKIESQNDKINKSVIDELVLKMYNKDIKNTSLTNSITDGVYYYELKDNNFQVIDFTNFPTYFYDVEEYKASIDELVIYTRVAQVNYIENGNFTIFNTKQNNEIKTFNDGEENQAKDYIKNNKDKFTEYKHTFKKNVTGYYWYQTEIVKD